MRKSHYSSCNNNSAVEEETKEMNACCCSIFHSSFLPSSDFRNLSFINSCKNQSLSNPINSIKNPLSLSNPSPKFSSLIRASVAMEGQQSTNVNDSMNNLLFVEMGVGYDQHGQDITAAAMRACRDAISSNSIPAFRRGSIPGVSFEQMKLQIKLGVPRAVQQFLDIDRVKSVFPYGKILSVDVVDGGLICSSGVHVEEMGDKNDDCYVVNAAVYVGY